MVPSPTAAYPEHATVIDDPSQGTVQFEKASYAQPYYSALGYQVVGSGLSGFAPGWGDAWAEVSGGNGAATGGGISSWWVLAAVAGALALAGLSKRKGR